MRSIDADGDPSRRRVLAAVGVASGAALAGCLDDGGPEYEAGEVPDVDGDPRTAEEMTAAQALAEQEVRERVSPLADLVLTDHEFVLEDGYEGATVQGTVQNDGDELVELVEVRVRVADADDTLLGRYLDRTGDLAGGEAWAFTVVLLESPAEVADYDIAVLGTPT